MVINFIRKDFKSLLRIANKVFFSPLPGLLDLKVFDEWIISHEIAHSFLIIDDFIQTGNQLDFKLINDIFIKLLAFATEKNLTLYWLIIRLLKLIFLTFQNASLWSVLPPLLQNKEITEKYIHLLGSFELPVIEMWPSQVVALPLAIGQNDGAVINLRTSGGKTRVAEIAILNTLATYITSKVLYLAPFRSLAIEVEQTLSKTFDVLDIKVSQLYGGATTNVSDFELINQSQVIIATPEKAKALIRCGSGIEKEIKLIVIDEGHLLGAEERYTRNEMFFTHINEFASRKQIRVLLLSAVLPNAGDLAQWIGGDENLVAKSDWKPSLERFGFLLWNGNQVNLEWLSEGNPFNPSFIKKAPLGFGKRRTLFPNNKNEAIAATAVQLAQIGTVMIYSARANSIEGLARSVILALGEHASDFLWDVTLWNVFEDICDEELGKDNIVLIAARKGIICHNNRLPTLVRIAIEKLMRSKAPLIIIASSTLGQGVNIGISTVIISTPYYSEREISNRDFWNICGRAGRAFSDVEGKILYAIDMTEDKWRVKKNRKLARFYFDNRQMEDVHSGLLVALKSIYRISQEANIDFHLLIEMIANDFVDSNGLDQIAEQINGIFDYLDDELLSMHEDFCLDENNIEWVDDVFRNSLAFIQAETVCADDYIGLLQARTKALIHRLPSQTIREKIVASDIPLSVSKEIFDDIDRFKTIALPYVLEADKDAKIQQIDNIIREVEIWSNCNAFKVMKSHPEQETLDQVRRDWITGVSLFKISESVQHIEKIVKDYYGFTLPWIIHAIAQMFDPVAEEDFVRAYSSIAMFVELGLPNQVAVNIYMAGIRSRSVALELSALEMFQNKNISEIKYILSDSVFQNENISNSAKTWIELIFDSTNKNKSRYISFPIFTLQHDNLPDKLYLRESDGEYFLLSGDGFCSIKVKSTNEIPFSKIANMNGVYFECKNERWYLRSHNPRIIIK